MTSVNKFGRIGIITGAGPDAGIDLWEKILKHNKTLYMEDYLGDLSAPEVIVHSIPQLGLAMNIEKHEEQLWQHLKTSLTYISPYVDFVCIACNVLHYFTDRINALDLSCEFISFVDVVEKAIQQVNDVALLSIGRVIEFGHYSPYKQSAEKYAIEVPCSKMMDELVLHIKHCGGADAESIRKFSDIIATLKSETLILACTDLPLLPLERYNKKFVDASALLAKELAEKSFYYNNCSSQ